MTTVKTLVMAFFCAFGIVVTNVTFAATPPVPVPLVDANIVNTPSVTIENVLSNPIPVTMDTGKRIPFSKRNAILTIEAGQRSGFASIDLSNYPTTGTLVIEQISTRSDLPLGSDLLDFFVITSYGEMFLEAPKVIPRNSTNESHRSSQSLRMYHDLIDRDFSIVYGIAVTVPTPRIVVINVNGYIVPEGDPSLAP